jgi:hypothetical protein
VAKDDQKQKLRIIQENIETKLKSANDRRQEQGEKLKGKLIEHVSSSGMVAIVFCIVCCASISLRTCTIILFCCLSACKRSGGGVNYFDLPLS